MNAAQQLTAPESRSRLIPDTRLLVLPGGNSYEFGERGMTHAPGGYPQLTAGLIEEFLDAP